MGNLRVVSLFVIIFCCSINAFSNDKTKYTHFEVYQFKYKSFDFYAVLSENQIDSLIYADAIFVNEDYKNKYCDMITYYIDKYQTFKDLKKMYFSYPLIKRNLLKAKNINLFFTIKKGLRSYDLDTIVLNKAVNLADLTMLSRMTIRPKTKCEGVLLFENSQLNNINGEIELHSLYVKYGRGKNSGMKSSTIKILP